MLTIGRINIEDAATRAGIRDALEAISAPDGADWRVEVSASAGPEAWDLLVDGPRRLRPEPDWQVTAATDSEARYRRLLRCAAERRPLAIRTAVRKLVWEQIEVRENGIASHDGDTAEAMEHAVWDVLSAHDLPPVQVRLGAWRGAGEPRYVCKIEARTLGEGGVPPWRWWSPIVGSSEELTAWLLQMLQARAIRPRARRSPSRPTVRPVPVASASAI
jgi:hypothetical protein